MYIKARMHNKRFNKPSSFRAACRAWLGDVDSNNIPSPHGRSAIEDYKSNIGLGTVFIFLLTYANGGSARSPLDNVVQHRERPAVRRV